MPNKWNKLDIIFFCNCHCITSHLDHQRHITGQRSLPVAPVPLLRGGRALAHHRVVIETLLLSGRRLWSLWARIRQIRDNFTDPGRELNTLPAWTQNLCCSLHARSLDPEVWVHIYLCLWQVADQLPMLPKPCCYCHVTHSIHFSVNFISIFLLVLSIVFDSIFAHFVIQYYSIIILYYLHI